MFTINSEYNLAVSSQLVDFLVFQSSVLLAPENCHFETGHSFDLTSKITSDDIISLFKLTNNFDVRYYYLNPQGLCVGYDLYGNPFTCDKHNNIVFINGHLVSSEYYEVGEDYLRFYVPGDINHITGEARPTIEWSAEDFITIVSSNKISSLKSYRFNGVGLDLFPSIDLDSKGFAPVKEKTIVFINGKILPIKKYVFGGGSLRLQVETLPTDKINVFVFDDGFEYFEYYPKSGQHIFNDVDEYSRRLRYATKEGACLLSIEAPWDEFTGIRTGYYVCAECYVNGDYKLGVAKIMDTEFTKSYVSADIISDFDQTEYDSSQWWMIPGEVKSIVSYLDERTQKTALYPEVLESYQRIVLDDYYDGIVRVQNSRNIAKMDEAFLSRTLNFLGLFLDVTDLGITNRRRALRELANFYSRIGTQKSTNYLGLIEDSLMTLTDALWTNDYIHFYTKEELGAKTEKRELVDWTDYRYISSQPTYTEDYGKLNYRNRFEFLPNGAGFKIEMGFSVLDSSTKDWKIINQELEFIPSLYSLEEKEYYILVVTDARGSSAFAVTESIPTDDSEAQFYYSSSIDKIICKGNPDVRVSLPIGKYFGQHNWILPFDVFSYTDDIMFTYKGSAYYYWTNEENVVTPNSRVLLNTIENNLSSFSNDDYYIVYNYNENNTDVSVEFVKKCFVHNIGSKIDPSFKRRLTVDTSQYVYDRYSKVVENLYDENEEVIVEDNGFNQIQYDSFDMWCQARNIGTVSEFPVSAKKYDICYKDGKSYVYTSNRLANSFEYDPEEKRFKIKGHLEYNSEEKAQIFVRDSSDPEWVEIEHELSGTNTDVSPYVTGELFFNLKDFNWYRFNGYTWIKSFVAVVGELQKQNDRIVSVIPYIHNAADWNFRKNYPTFVAHTDNKPYNRQYSLERNTVLTPAVFNKVFDVAYNWGKITESPNLGWVMYTEFTPPQGYYPTNHVLFNYTANNIEDTQEMIASAKYKFYEVCPTPWVLQDIANVLLFESAVTWLGSASHGQLDQYFYPMDRYIKVRFVHDSNDKLSITSSNRMYLFSTKDKCGTRSDVKRIISNDIIDSVETLLYSKDYETNDLERYAINSFSYVEPNIPVENFDKYCICTKFNTELTLELTSDFQTDIYQIKVPSCQPREDEVIINLESLRKKSDVYTINVEVVSENTEPSDVIKVLFNGKPRNQIKVYLCNTDRFIGYLDVQQNGTNGYKEGFFIRKSNFINNTATIRVHLLKNLYTVRFLSNFGDDFNLYIKDGNEYVLQTSKVLSILYNTIIEFKYTRDNCNDYVESINIKEDKYISRTLLLRYATLSVKVNPVSVKPIIDNLVQGSVSKQLESDIVWSAGNYRYTVQKGLVHLLSNTNIPADLVERPEWYSFEDKEDPTRDGKIDIYSETTAPLLFTENTTLTIPSSINRIRVDCVAAVGAGAYGGAGGRVQCYINNIAGQTLQLIVGKARSKEFSVAGVNDSTYNSSDIRISPYGIWNRIVVAGGGGNTSLLGGKRNEPIAGWYAAGGVGGGTTGAYGGGVYPGPGGSQTSSGVNPQTGATSGNNHGGVPHISGGGSNGGRGGDGWFGGGGGGSSVHIGSHAYGSGGGGGGSSYVNTSYCSSIPGVPLHTQGYCNGSGYIIIWYII